ncbi:universal stress protein [Terrabacter sp. RAF57]|uniref:universal stress protein n=1 Tax=Terrabacter sp. RAF57 TaxID=3233063 RepID=UPI003F956BFC
MVKGIRIQDVGPACGQIVVGYDGSPASQCALVWAAAVSRVLDDSLKIIHAVELDLVPSRRGYALRPLSPSLEMVARTIVGGPSTWPGPALARGRVRAVHAVGGPAPALVDASMSAELVVLGTRGRGRARPRSSAPSPTRSSPMRTAPSSSCTTSAASRPSRAVTRGSRIRAARSSAPSPAGTGRSTLGA